MKQLKRKYNNNEDMRTIIDEVFSYNGLKKNFISNQMGLTSQAFNSLLNKKNINLNDLKKICDIVGYDIEINLIPKNQNKQN